jgi:hypothetical protein
MTNEEGLVPVNQHGQEVLDRVNVIKERLIENFLELSALLADIYNNKYFELSGYSNFSDYVEQSSLDINISTAYRMVRLINSSKLLGVSPEQMRLIRPTKLLEIFSLNPTTNQDDIHALLKEGDKNTVDEVKKRVRKVKGLGEEVFYRFSVEKDVADLCIEPAINKCKAEYGDTTSSDGEIKDISNSKAFELICIEYLNQPNMKQPVIDIKSEEPEDDSIGSDFQ